MQEYKASNFGSSSVSYLAAINAAPAFEKHIKLENSLNYTTTLQNVKVGMVDTGVWATHSEFYNPDTITKVSGHNYDYGPCTNNNKSPCWYREGNTITLRGVYPVVSHTFTRTSELNEYIKWENSFADDYAWWKVTESTSPNSIKTNNDYSLLHGTNIAGIIAANLDNSGTMGVAFANASIDAIRWDFYSSIQKPIESLLNDNVAIINLSLGQDASVYSAKDATNKVFSDNFSKAMREVIVKNTVTEAGKTDGVIIVKAAGNEKQDNPDLQSGIKLSKTSFLGSDHKYHSYNELQMVVVTSVVVNVNQNTNKVSSYYLSSFSNKKKKKKNYCISAPGGNITNNTYTSSLWGPGEPGTDANYYDFAGTSQAVPVVSGALAFLKGAYPFMSSSELIELIMDTANKDAAVSYSPETYGAGLLDLGAAVNTYISRSDSPASITTYDGNRISSSKVVELDDANLIVSGAMKAKLMQILPHNITVFDRYNRPFDLDTAKFFTITHSGYKALKNDVINIARSNKVQKVNYNNVQLTFTESEKGNSANGLGFVEFKNVSAGNSWGFYFNENTHYDAENYFNRDLNNPFMQMTSAYGAYNTYDLRKYLQLKVEALTGRNGLYDGDHDFQDKNFDGRSYALASSAVIKAHKDVSFEITTGTLYEKDALLGTIGSGALGVNNSNTYILGLTGKWQISPKLILSGSYYQGHTKSQNMESDLIHVSALRSDSFAADINYKPDKNINFGFRVSSPLKIQNGKMSFDFPNGRDGYSDAIYRNKYQARLRPNHREYKFTFYLDNNCTDNLTLRTEFDVRVHPEHEDVKNDYRALIGLSWNFN